MRRIAHISDLHFGRTDRIIVEGLLGDLERSAVNLVCVTGDLTQRARRKQFEEARAFLDRLPARWLGVPGNHDLAPVFEPLQRLLDPFGRYRRYISDELCPVYQDEELLVVGLNTVRRLRWAEGEISEEQLRALERATAGAAPSAMRVVCTHHPFLPPPAAPRTRLVGGAFAALEVLERCGVDLLLAGHLHHAYSGDVLQHHTRIRRSILVAQASTATSTRVRNDPNAYNLIEIAPGCVTVDIRSWTGEKFESIRIESYRKTEHAWKLTAEAALRGENFPERRA
jgi:3',5'-cyclic AMP phosphodiesterase CpdA